MAEDSPSGKREATALPPLQEPALTHPEEMRGSVALRIGERSVFEASGRVTPAGLICAGLSVAAITVAFGFVVRAARALPTPRRF